MRKYSDKFLNDSKLLQNSVIGFEFEFYSNSISYYKMLELLNNYLSPVKVEGFRVYHPDGIMPSDTKFILTPDLSGGSNMIELITGPMEYNQAKYYLIKILKFIDEYGYTTDRSSIHFNISFADADLNDLNSLKLILSTDEEEIYRDYPSRKGNVYAKSVKKMIPYQDYDFKNVPISAVSNNLRLPDDKYYGINFLHKNKSKSSARIEFRYIGGKDWHKDIGKLMYHMDKFIINTRKAINGVFDDNDVIEMENFLEYNINQFNNVSKYDNFVINYPTITIQIDQMDGYDMINSYYPKIYDKIYPLVDGIENLSDCILNYISTQHRIEVVDAKVKANFNIKDYDFINCYISDGIFDECGFINCEIDNCQFKDSTFDGCDIKGSKLTNCNCETTNLDDCFFMGGYLNCEMNGGVLRSGKLGPYANVSSETKVITDSGSFFNTRFDTETGKSEKGVPQSDTLKGFKK